CLFLIILTVLMVQVCESVTKANPFYDAQRLRLRVDQNTLRSGGTTKVYVEFLNREYQQVPNDRSRDIQFQLASAGSQQTGSGSFSPDRIRIEAGAWSGETTFISGQPGKLLLVAASEGLESGQVLLFVTRGQASFLSRLIETVAYAAEEIELLPPNPRPTVANKKSPAIIYVVLSEPPTSPLNIRVTTDPAARIIYNGRESFAFVDIPLDQTKAASDQIQIISDNPGSVGVCAKVLPRGDKKTLELQFAPRVPSKIVFEGPATITSTQGEVPISLGLVDSDGVPVDSEKQRDISLSIAAEPECVRFASTSVTLAQGQPSVQAMFHLQDLPAGNEIKLLAIATADSRLGTGEKSILIQSPIEKILVSGPTEVNRGRKEVQFTIRLADKNNKPLIADWKRTINLGVDRGKLSVSQAVIEKGQDSTVVTYYSPKSTGRSILTAESRGLESGRLTVNVITPEYWLILFAIVGALMGGVARQLHKDARFENIRPRWKDDTLELGLTGRLACSIIGGLFFYWSIKFGLSQAFGLPVLPATLDMGSKIVAVLLGCTGGFAGTLVLQKVADRIFPDGKTAAPAQPQQQSA
ncbi:MAG TPA: hypothetical protein VF075_14450, partial [Pyrinomonadaceae bacterium]